MGVDQMDRYACRYAVYLGSFLFPFVSEKIFHCKPNLAQSLNLYSTHCVDNLSCPWGRSKWGWTKVLKQLHILNSFKMLDIGFEIYLKCRFWLFSCLASNLLSLLWDFEQYRTLCVSPAFNNNIMVNFEIWSNKEKSVSTVPLPNWWLDSSR